MPAEWCGELDKVPPGDPFQPSLPEEPLVNPVPTFTVKQLRELLSELPDDAPIGVGMSGIHGWVQGIAALGEDEHGCVIIDQHESTLYNEEVEISW